MRSRGICAVLLEFVLLEQDLIVGQNVLRELEKALRDNGKLPAARTSEMVEFVVDEATEVVERGHGRSTRRSTATTPSC